MKIFSNLQKAERRRVVLMLVVVLVSSFMIAVLMTSQKGVSAFRSIYGGQVKGESTDKYWTVSASDCEMGNDPSRTIVIGDSHSADSAYMPDAKKKFAVPAKTTRDFVSSSLSEEMNYISYLEEHASEIDYAVIMLGTNDCTGSTEDPIAGVSTTEFEKNLLSIAKKVASYGVTPVLSTFPLRTTYPVRCDENAYNTIIRNLAETNRWPLRDVAAASQDDLISMKSDGLHMDADGVSNINKIQKSMCSDPVEIEGKDSSSGDDSGGDNGDTGTGDNGSSSSSGNGEGGNVCERLGLETGQIEAVVPKEEKYYQVDLGVVATVVCPSDSVDRIADIAHNSPASNIHVVRLGHGGCTFSEEEAIRMISEVRQRTYGLSGPKVYFMIGNEPRTDWASKFEDDCNEGGNCTAGTKGGEYTEHIVKGVQQSGLSGTSNTSDFLIFPAFNYHRPDGPGTQTYIANFFSGYKVAGGDLNADFTSFGVSIQKEGASDDFSSRISSYKSILDSQGISGYKIDLFGANVVNYEANQEFVDDLLGALKDHEDVEGAYIFSPWGWDFDPTGRIKNYRIPMDIWEKLFEECLNIDENLSCKSPIEDYPGISNCNEPKSSGIMTKFKIKYENGQYTALPILTQQASMTLLNWMGDENSLNRVFNRDFKGPLEGTDSNPFPAPCATDKKNNEEYAALSKQFSGPIRFYYDKEEDRYTDYQINLLGNAIACMIWDSSDFTPGTTNITAFEPRFKLTEEEELNANQSLAGFLENSGETVQNVKSKVLDWILKMLSKLQSTDDKCDEDIYSRVEPSDKLTGIELMVEDNLVAYNSDAELCSAIKVGTVTVEPNGYPIKPELAYATYCPGGKNYVGVPAWLYYNYIKESVDEAMIPGSAEAMAELWQEERQQIPWGQYEVAHRDKSAIQIDFTQSAYDGLSNDKTDYKEPANTDESCTIYKYTGDKKVKGTGESEFIMPFIGQSLNIQVRLNKIFSNYKEADNVNYLDDRHAEIETFLEVPEEKHNLDYYRQVLMTVLDSTHIYTCDDLNDLSKYIRDGGGTEKERELYSDALDRVDCLYDRRVHPNRDPMRNWLCDNNYVEKYVCATLEQQCVPESEIADKKGIVGLSCPLKQDIACGQGVGGNYSHDVDTKDPVTLVNEEVIALDLVTNNADKTVYAPEDVTVVSPAVEYHSDVLEGTCGLRLKLESNSRPGLFYSMYHLNTDASLNNPKIYDKGETIKQGEELGQLMPGQPYEHACIKGQHLHISANYEGKNPVDPYLLFENSCGKISCVNEDKSILNNSSVILDPADIKTDYSGLLPDDAMCKTEDGEEGYLSDRILDEPQKGATSHFYYANPTELQKSLLNACPVRVENCDEKCKKDIKAWVVRLANKNIAYLGADYNETDYYSINEIEKFIDKMYEEAHDDISFQLLISIWLSENGLNPTFKNKGFDSDVFGCGVSCSDPPHNFDEELACVTRKLDGCSMNYTFSESHPGEYLEKYGPIEDNPTFATKVFMILDKLAAIQGAGSYRDQSGGECSMYVYDEIPSDLDWAAGLLNNT